MGIPVWGSPYRFRGFGVGILIRVKSYDSINVEIHKNICLSASTVETNDDPKGSLVVLEEVVRVGCWCGRWCGLVVWGAGVGFQGSDVGILFHVHVGIGESL